MRYEMETAEYKIRIAPKTAVAHIRKNHALEHATIHLLTEAKPGVSFAGYSFIKGYWILGNAELQDIQKAAEMALARLNNGEKNLAIHPNCGTNLAVIGLCTAAAAMITTMDTKDDDSALSRFGAYTTAGLIGALAGKPLGPKVQKRFTTDANVRGISIVSINCSSFRGRPAFFVETSLDQE